VSGQEAEAIEQPKAPKYAFDVQAGSKHRLRVVGLYSVGWIRDFKGTFKENLHTMEGPGEGLLVSL